MFKFTLSYFSICSFVVSTVLFCSCERDDICSEDTPKTPLLTIAFIDNSGNVARPKNLEIAFDQGLSEELAFVPAENAETVSIPLDTRFNSTRLFMSIETEEVDSDMQPIRNVDTLNLIYSRSTEYISRACGYRTIYNALTAAILEENDEDRWMERVGVIEPTIDSSEDTHLNITL